MDKEVTVRIEHLLDDGGRVVLGYIDGYPATAVYSADGSLQSWTTYYADPVDAADDYLRLTTTDPHPVVHDEPSADAAQPLVNE